MCKGINRSLQYQVFTGVVALLANFSTLIIIAPSPTSTPSEVPYCIE
jgi:hypothetical protein